MGVGTLAGLMMILAEFLLIRYVTTITASCSDLASPAVKATCQTTGHAKHHWALAIIGVITILMAFGAAAGRSRPAAYALLAMGIVCLFITLALDLPDTSSKGEVGPNFASASAHIGLGFWFELIGGLLAIGAALFALTQLPGVATAEAGVAAEEEEAAAAEEAGPAEEPSTEAAMEPEAAKEAEPETVEASTAVAGADEAPAGLTRAERIRGVRRGLGQRVRGRRRPGAAEPADVGSDEGSEGEAVAPDSAEAAKAEEAGPRVAKAETAEAEAAEAEKAKSEPAEPEGETWDVIPDTPAARRSAERRRKRQERAEAARKRQKRPPRERDRKKKPEGG